MTFLRWVVTLTALVLLTIALSSCDTTSSPDLEPELDLVTIGSASSDDYTISLESNSPLETGANQLYWKVKRDGDLVTPESITIKPMMDMGDMMHSTPFQQPEVAPEDDRYFSNIAVFIMASGMMGSWSIEFEITLPNQEILTGEIPVGVDSSWRLTSVRDDNDKIYFITWLQPRQPVTGNNTLGFMVHTRESMMSFPPVENAELEIYPFMDMGGGTGHSTEFNPPVADGNGYYEGSINYSMSGTWTTSATLKVGDVTLPEVMFEYSVQAQ